jgi:phosphoenolpyruvate synthase/pyruvate phosphate dikinase
MTNTTPLSLSFSYIRAADLPLVGGKGANLGEMSGGKILLRPNQ